MNKNIVSHIGLNDVYFKTLLKEEKDVLEVLINGLCDLNIKKEEIELYDTEIIDNVSFHTTRFDVSIKVINTNIDIESELNRHGDINYYHNRETFYASRLYAQGYKNDKSLDYNTMHKAIVLFLYNFDTGSTSFKI